MCNNDPNSSKITEYDVLLQDFLDIQNIIRAQDTKIGILFVVLVLPFNQFQFAHLIVSKIIVNVQGLVLFTMLACAWLVSFLALVYGIYPRYSKKNPTHNPKIVGSEYEQYVENLRYNRDYIESICKKKITGIRICLWAMMIWNLLGMVLVVVMSGELKTY